MCYFENLDPWVLPLKLMIVLWLDADEIDSDYITFNNLFPLIQWFACVWWGVWLRPMDVLSMMVNICKCLNFCTWDVWLQSKSKEFLTILLILKTWQQDRIGMSIVSPTYTCPDTWRIKICYLISVPVGYRVSSSLFDPRFRFVKKLYWKFDFKKIWLLHIYF